MKKTLLVILLLILFQKTYSQNFVEGKITFFDGTTKSGFIKDSKANKLNTICNFKNAQNETNVQSFDPTQIKSYEIDTRVFVSKLIKKNNAMINVFLLKLVGGRASLYAYGDDFIIEKDTKIHSLIRSDTIINHSNLYIVDPKASNNYSLYNNRTYFQKLVKFQLDTLFIDCLERHFFLNKISSYSIEDMVSATVSYNKCVNQQDFIYTKSKLNKRLYFYPQFGISDLTYSDGYSNITISNGYMWGLGMAFQISGDKLLNNRLISQFELDFARYNYTNNNYKLSFASAGVYLQYALLNPESKLFPYLEIGIRPNVHIGRNWLSTNIPVGVGCQTGWKSKNKIQANIRYLQLKDASFTNMRNIVLSLKFSI